MAGDQANTGKIIVLADDLSGAAELAGIAFAHGLSAEVQREFEPTSSAKVVAIDTDSRHLESAAAAARVKQITEQVAATRPAWLFKKVDSVLRGNVRAEIEAILEATGQPRALLVPANPSRGRIIRGGRYLIDGIPLDQTPFAQDPHWPRTSCKIAALLGDAGEQHTRQIAADAPLPGTGIIVPEVESSDDLFRRGMQADQGTLLAGAADFFTTLILQRHPRQRRPARSVAFQHPALLVCGSLAAWPARRQHCQAAGIPILSFSGNCAQSCPANFRQLLMGIAESDPAIGKMLCKPLAGLAKFVADRSSVKTVLAEGGGTAAAIAQEMGWQRFQVVATAPAGVGVLQPLGSDASNAPLFLIKPGSYPWPAEIWQRFCEAESKVQGPTSKVEDAPR